MIRLFPYYMAVQKCNYEMEKAINIIRELEGCKKKGLLIKEVAYYSEKQTVVLNIKSYCYRNSFIPLTSIEMQKKEYGTRLLLRFEIQKGVKTVLTFFILMLLLSSFVTIGMRIKSIQVNSIPILLPAIMTVCSMLVTIIGLWISAKKVMALILGELSIDLDRQKLCICWDGVR